MAGSAAARRSPSSVTPRVVARGQIGRAEPVGERDHRVEPHVAVAADARVRRHAFRVALQERVDDAGAERLAQVQREVRHAHPVRDRACHAHGVRGAAGGLGVVLGVRPQLERDRDDRALPREQRGDRGVHPAAHRDERAAGIGRERGLRVRGAAERAVQRVGDQVGGVELAGREPAQLRGDVVRADAGGVEQRLALDERDGGRGRGGERAAARGLEAPGRPGRPPRAA